MLKRKHHNAETRKKKKKTNKKKSVSITPHLSHGTLGSTLLISLILENLSALFLSKTFPKS